MVSAQVFARRSLHTVRLGSVPIHGHLTRARLTNSVKLFISLFGLLMSGLLIFFLVFYRGFLGVFLLGGGGGGGCCVGFFLDCGVVVVAEIVLFV